MSADSLEVAINKPFKGKCSAQLLTISASSIGFISIVRRVFGKKRLIARRLTPGA
jgi:hypothetical protein